MNNQREHIFKGKLIDDSAWVEGYFVKYDSGVCTISEPYDKNSMNQYRIIPETVGEYTGLTDKNGIRIFEGDIVRYNGANHRVVFESRGYGGYFGIVISPIETWGFGKSAPPYLMEVIGNVHDTPELLEVWE